MINAHAPGERFRVHQEIYAGNCVATNAQYRIKPTRIESIKLAVNAADLDEFNLIIRILFYTAFLSRIKLSIGTKMFPGNLGNRTTIFL